jgi:hypothetical protein
VVYLDRDDILDFKMLAVMMLTVMQIAMLSLMMCSSVLS